MDANREKRYRALFLVAAVYDVVLGITFTFFHTWAFDVLGIGDEAPQGAYIPLLGVFVLVIGIAYYLIYLGDLQKNRDLVLVGTLYKLAYASITIVFGVAGDAPHALFVLFGVFDAIFLALMAECWLYLRKLDAAPTS